MSIISHRLLCCGFHSTASEEPKPFLPRQLAYHQLRRATVQDGIAGTGLAEEHVLRRVHLDILFRHGLAALVVGIHLLDHVGLLHGLGGVLQAIAFEPDPVDLDESVEGPGRFAAASLRGLEVGLREEAKCRKPLSPLLLFPFVSPCLLGGLRASTVFLAWQRILFHLLVKYVAEGGENTVNTSVLGMQYE